MRLEKSTENVLFIKYSLQIKMFEFFHTYLTIKKI